LAKLPVDETADRPRSIGFDADEQPRNMRRWLVMRKRLVAQMLGQSPTSFG
jgi:hypothetical protein